ncbi:BON domain-containing protein [Mesoterricola sediminis]|uniref:BON domain-containing protein n=1 Tax=Mesoterricola sediminis TaxID=2927980 RepID=A0AA48GZM6_9BACT|nr:BON domain-containing protein [Mesoterricola sediminis]BDU76967.1 hypothetical protein METESE_19250 [Mesoterricola sediminis]
MKAHVLTILLATGLGAAAQQPPPTPPPDRPTHEGRTHKHAQDQGAADADTALARQIRKELKETKGLSAKARALKVAAKGGQVTLRGTVATAEEKDQVEAIARRLAGEGKVTSEVKVKKAP